MKTFALVALVSAVAAISASFIQAKRSPSPPSSAPKVGTNPGDIGTSKNIDASASARGHELAVFAAGCFWGVEETFRRTPGVTATAVGYTGGTLENPSYEQVCTHTTGHAESVLVEFDPKKTSYEKLVKVFFSSHDPTQVNRQGPDVGTNYRSAIFYRNDDQKKTALAVKGELERAGKYKRPIATQIAEAKPFYLAEDYHQQWDEKHGIEACPPGGGG